ncbi:hypothetical protein Tco_1205785 [Tanacetum coccineum]
MQALSYASSKISLFEKVGYMHINYDTALQFYFHVEEEGTLLANIWIDGSGILEGSGDFSVASVRKLLDGNMLPEVASKTRWIKAMPIKIDMTNQMKVWFLREVALEDCFADDLHDQCSQVRAYMEKRGQMMLELGRLGGRGAAVDCLDRLRLMQKSDAKKHVSFRRMLLEAQVETHERQLVVAFVGMS